MNPKDKKKVIAIYRAPFSSCKFSAPMIDDKGKPIPKINPATGTIFMLNGVPQYEETSHSFEVIISNVKFGSMCSYTIYSDTPKHIAEKLKALAEDPGTRIMTDDTWMKERNPEQYKEKQMRLNIEKDIETKAAALADEIIENSGGVLTEEKKQEIEQNNKAAVDKAVKEATSDANSKIQEMQKRLSTAEANAGNKGKR